MQVHSLLIARWSLELGEALSRGVQQLLCLCLDILDQENLSLQYEGWLKARAGLAAGVLPKLATAGTGGSYFIQDKSGESVAVFKPEDEEPLAPNNPKGHSSGGLEGYR